MAGEAISKPRAATWRPSFHSTSLTLIAGSFCYGVDGEGARGYDGLPSFARMPISRFIAGYLSTAPDCRSYAELAQYVHPKRKSLELGRERTAKG